jgi:hypothetical protein
MTTTGRSRYEMRANAIAKKLVKALREIESFDGDPEDILSDAEIHMHGMGVNWKGAREALAALKMYYCGDQLPEHSVE